MAGTGGDSAPGPIPTLAKPSSLDLGHSQSPALLQNGVFLPAAHLLCLPGSLVLL